MKLRLFVGAFCAALAFGVSSFAGAQAPAAAPTATTPAAEVKPDDAAKPMDSVKPAEVAPIPVAATAAPSAPAATAAKAPEPNKGDTAWMMVSTLLVIMMAVPGLALFYGGLVRSKNVLSVLMQVMVTFSLVVVLWLI
ncbi:MAG: ammonia channel protein, partial [Casimicrobium sp.]